MTLQVGCMTAESINAHRIAMTSMLSTRVESMGESLWGVKGGFVMVMEILLASTDQEEAPE